MQKTHWQRYSIDELLARARNELRINPTITTYYFIDGDEYRQARNPWFSLAAAANRAATSITELGKSMQEMMRSLNESP